MHWHPCYLLYISIAAVGVICRIQTNQPNSVWAVMCCLPRWIINWSRLHSSIHFSMLFSAINTPALSVRYDEGGPSLAGSVMAVRVARNASYKYVNKWYKIAKLACQTLSCSVPLFILVQFHLPTPISLSIWHSFLFYILDSYELIILCSGFNNECIYAGISVTHLSVNAHSALNPPLT